MVIFKGNRTVMTSRRLVQSSGMRTDLCFQSSAGWAGYHFSLGLCMNFWLSGTIYNKYTCQSNITKRVTIAYVIDDVYYMFVDDGDGNRIGTGCSKDDIVIYQGQLPPLPSGIPSYTVQITNMCASDCSIADIRLYCGWFSSARLINPRVFRRVRYNDCLVNDGQPLGPGITISFQYANTFRYPLSVSSVACMSWGATSILYNTELATDHEQDINWLQFYDILVYTTFFNYSTN